MDRSQEGFVVHDMASGRPLGAVAMATMREALVRVWEAVRGAGPE